MEIKEYFKYYELYPIYKETNKLHLWHRKQSVGTINKLCTLCFNEKRLQKLINKKKIYMRNVEKVFFHFFRIHSAMILNYFEKETDEWTKNILFENYKTLLENERHKTGGIIKKILKKELIHKVDYKTFQALDDNSFYLTIGGLIHRKFFYVSKNARSKNVFL